jgi:hypothetical protein
MPVSITVDPIPLEKTLEMLGKFGKQIAFAESKAINEVLVIVQKSTIEKLLPGKFTIRKNWARPRSRFGFNVNFSNKRKLVGNVGSKAPWLKLQEKGGTKTRAKTTPVLGEKVVLLPTREIRKTKGRLIPGRLSPAKLLKNAKKNRVFFVKTKDGTRLMLQRKGKGKNSKIRTLFYALSSTKIKANLKYEETSRKLIQKIYNKKFGKWLSFAIATAGGNMKSDK